jgi:hypothetical protein
VRLFTIFFLVGGASNKVGLMFSSIDTLSNANNKSTLKRKS